MLQVLLILILVLSILALCAEKGKDEQHEFEVTGLKNTISGFSARLKTANESLECYKIFNKNQKEKLEMQGKQIAEQTETIVKLERRLAKAVENLDEKTIKFLEAWKKKNYTYSVVRNGQTGKIFSLEKFAQAEEQNKEYVAKWVKKCDGQPAVNGWVTGIDGVSYCSHEDWEIPSETIVEIPMNSKYPDYEAKKAAGIKDKDMKGVKAVRWSL